MDHVEKARDILWRLGYLLDEYQEIPDPRLKADIAYMLRQLKHEVKSIETIVKSEVFSGHDSRAVRA